MRYYVVDYDPTCRDIPLSAIAEFFCDYTAPASTLIGVSALYLPGLMMEIDTAAVN